MSENQTYQNRPQSLTNRAASAPQEEDTIDLLELAYALLAKWKWIAAAALACALAAGIVVFVFVTPKYQASATIYVVSNKDSAINISDLQLGSALTNDYIEVFQMWEVHEKVISALDLPYTYEEMSDRLTITNTTNTRMIEIAFTSASPEEAADVANEYAEVARQYIAERMVTDKPTIMSTARVPEIPISPNKTKTVLIGAALGFVASAGVVVALFLLDDTYKTADDIKKYTGLVTLASIPVEKKPDTEHHHKPLKYGILKLPGGLKL